MRLVATTVAQQRAATKLTVPEYLAGTAAPRVTAPVPPSQRSERAMPPALGAVLLACLAKRPADRLADAADVVHLRAVAAGAGIDAPDAFAVAAAPR